MDRNQIIVLGSSPTIMADETLQLNNSLWRWYVGILKTCDSTSGEEGWSVMFYNWMP